MKPAWSVPINREKRRKILRYAKKHGIREAIEKFDLPMDEDAIMARARKNLRERMMEANG